MTDWPFESYLNHSLIKKCPIIFGKKYGKSSHSGKNERKLYFESRIELLSTKSTLGNCSSKGCTQGDLPQNFPTFPNPILNFDFYVGTHPDLDGKKHTRKTSLNLRIHSLFATTDPSPKKDHFMVLKRPYIEGIICIK